MSPSYTEKGEITFCVFFFSTIHERHCSVQVASQHGDELIDETRRRVLNKF